MISIPYELTPTNLAQSVRSIEQFTKAASSSVAQIESAFSGLKGIVAGVFAGFTLKRVIDEASESEDALARLNIALRASGDFSEKAFKSFTKFADELALATGVQDEAITRQIAFSKSLGLTDDQSKKVIKTAIDLSAFLGQSLDTSVAQLTQTLNGNATGLRKIIPELKNFSIEQLAAGQGVDVIAKKLNGLAESLSNTFSGAVNVSRIGISNFAEALGGAFVNNATVVSGIKGLGTLFNEFAKAIAANNEPIQFLVSNGFRALVQVIPILIRGVELLDNAFTKLSNGFNFVSGIAATIAARFTTSGSTFEAVAKSIGEADAKAADAANAALAKRNSLYDDLVKSSDGYISSLSDAKKAEISLANSAVKATQQRIDAVNELAEAQRKQIRDAQRNVVEKGAANPIAGFAGAGIAENFKQIKGATPTDISNAQAAAQQGAVIGQLAQVFKGAEGATTAISQFVGFAADKLLPGIGSVVADIVKVLALGPEKVKEFVSSFVQAIPQLITNIVESINQLPSILIQQIGPLITKIFEQAPQIFLQQFGAGLPDLIISIADQIPVIIDAFIAGIPRFIERFLQGIVELVSKLISSIPRIIDAFISQMPRAAAEFSSSLVQNIPTIVTQFINSLISEAPRFITELIKQIPNAATGGLIPGLGGGGGGGFLGGIVGGIGDFFGFAEGGLVPAGFPNDTFPARLSSGELIIPPNDVGRLSKFLDSQQSGDTSVTALNEKVDALTRLVFKQGGGDQNLNINLNVGEEQLVQTQAKINRQGFRV